MGSLIEGVSSDARDTVVGMPITAGDSATYSAEGHSHRGDRFEAIAPGGEISSAVDLPGGPVPGPVGRAARHGACRPEAGAGSAVVHHASSRNKAHPAVARWALFAIKLFVRKGVL